MMIALAASTLLYKLFCDAEALPLQTGTIYKSFLRLFVLLASVKQCNKHARLKKTARGVKVIERLDSE